MAMLIDAGLIERLDANLVGPAAEWTISRRWRRASWTSARGSTTPLRLAALLVCIMRMLYRLRTRNQRWRLYTPMLIRENRWRAMRYSFDEGLIDLAKGEVVPFEELIE